MDIAELLRDLNDLGISVTVNSGHIKLVPGSLVPSEVAQTLREHKSDILAYLTTGNKSQPRTKTPDNKSNFGFPKAQVEVAETINDGYGLIDSDHRRYNVLAWVRGYYQDRNEVHSDRYEELVREQLKLGRILRETGIG